MMRSTHEAGEKAKGWMHTHKRDIFIFLAGFATAAILIGYACYHAGLNRFFE